MRSLPTKALGVSVDKFSCFKYINPALTPDRTFPINYITSDAQKTEGSPPNTRNHINLEDVPSSPSILTHIPKEAQETHVVYTKIQKMARNHNVPFGYFNQTTWKPQQDPPAPLITLPQQQWDSNQFSFTANADSKWIDLVVNNLDEGAHPFHMVSFPIYLVAL